MVRGESKELIPLSGGGDGRFWLQYSAFLHVKKSNTAAADLDTTMLLWRATANKHAVAAPLGERYLVTIRPTPFPCL